MKRRKKDECGNMGDVRKKESKKRKERNREVCESPVCVDVCVCVSGTKVSHPWFTKH